MWIRCCEKRVKKMPKLSKFGSIKNNMMMYSLGIILLMALLSMYSLSIMERYKGEIQRNV